VGAATYQHKVGVDVRLQDGGIWTVPARPLFGPVADQIVAGLDELAQVSADQVMLQVDFARLGKRAEEIDQLAEEVDPEQLAQLKAEREQQLEELRVEGKALTDRAKELERRGQRVAFDVIGAALRCNYPDVTEEQLCGLISAAHLRPLLEIVRGERQLDDLFPPGRSRADPQTA